MHCLSSAPVIRFPFPPSLAWLKDARQVLLNSGPPLCRNKQSVGRQPSSEGRNYTQREAKWPLRNMLCAWEPFFLMDSAISTYWEFTLGRDLSGNRSFLEQILLNAVTFLGGCLSLLGHFSFLGSAVLIYLGPCTLFHGVPSLQFKHKTADDSVRK